MKLYNTYQELILETVNGSQIGEAIDGHYRVKFYYDGDETINAGWRTVEVYGYGLSKAGNPVIEAYQIWGVTDTTRLRWKLFRVDRISGWQKSGWVFDAPISDRDPSVPKYNPNGHNAMSTVYKKAKF